MSVDVQRVQQALANCKTAQGQLAVLQGVLDELGQHLSDAKAERNAAYARTEQALQERDALGAELEEARRQLAFSRKVGGGAVLKSKAPSAGVLSASVALHKEDDQDEPLEVDVDATVICVCGVSSAERHAIYKEADWVPVMCAACGATYRVDIQTTLAFAATASRETGSVLSRSPSPSPRRGGPHAP